MYGFANISGWDDEEGYYEHCDECQRIIEEFLPYYDDDDEEMQYELAVDDAVREYPYDQWMKDEFDRYVSGNRELAGSILVGGLAGMYPAFSDEELYGMLGELAYNCSVDHVDCGDLLFRLAEGCLHDTGVELNSSRITDMTLLSDGSFNEMLATASFLSSRDEENKLFRCGLNSKTISGFLHELANEGYFDLLESLLDACDDPEIRGDVDFNAYYEGVPLEDIFA